MGKHNEEQSDEIKKIWSNSLENLVAVRGDKQFWCHGQWRWQGSGGRQADSGGGWDSGGRQASNSDGH